MFGLSLKSVLFYAASDTVAAFSSFAEIKILYTPKKRRKTLLYLLPFLLLPFNILSSLLIECSRFNNFTYFPFFVATAFVLLLSEFYGVLTQEGVLTVAFTGLLLSLFEFGPMALATFLCRGISPAEVYPVKTLVSCAIELPLNILLAFLIKKFLLKRIVKIPPVIKSIALIFTLAFGVLSILQYNTELDFDIINTAEFRTVEYTMIFFAFFPIAVISVYFLMKNAEDRRRLVSRYEGEKTEFFSTLKEYNAEISKMNHDIQNHLRTISVMAQNADAEECMRYSRELVGEYGEKMKSFCENAALNSLFLYYDKKCREEGVKLNADCVLKENTFLLPTDTVAIFSNLLSNAFEAAKKEENPEITFYAGEKDGALTALCENTCTKAPKKRGGELVTSKRDGKNHGLGTKIVKDTVRKYDGKCSFDFADGKFTASVYIPNEISAAVPAAEAVRHGA